MQDRIIVLGASGQIGTVLTAELRNVYGVNNVLATDIYPQEHSEGPFEVLDVLNIHRMAELFEAFKPTQVYHLAAILSANGESNIKKTWHINMDGFLRVLEIALEKGVSKIFFPSSIAVYGPTTPKVDTPQDCPLLPSTVYGISKMTGEVWSDYMFQRYGLDIRSLRYPGVIGWQSIPSGGTTDYAVEIYHEAFKKGHYECFLKEDTMLPMIYMPDAIRATIELMDAPKASIGLHYGYNLSGMSFTPKQIADSIRYFMPEFTISYQPDFRQEIAESWVKSIDDSRARKDWGWKPAFDLHKMTMDMLLHLQKQYGKVVISPVS